MIVTQSNFIHCLDEIRFIMTRACDTETTGLRPYHSDHLFSMIIARPEKAWYFNFQKYDGQPIDEVLTKDQLRTFFKTLDHLGVIWVFHNAKFDMAFLDREGITIIGEIYCTKAMARIEHNDYLKYSLKDCLIRMPGDWAKDDKVMEYIQEHKLKTKKPIEGKQTEEEILHFDRVPFGIIHPYGEADGMGTAALQRWQMERFLKLDSEEPLTTTRGRSLMTVVKNEMRLTKTVFKMEKVGVKVDLNFCRKAIEYEETRVHKAKQSFLEQTGQEFKDSGTLFEKVFESDKARWGFTEKGNPSFDADFLGTFEHPASKQVLEIRDAKSKKDFYYGFIHHSDRDQVVHPDFVPEGTIHGRFSSRNPNFQNLTSSEEEELVQEFIVRRAIVPREGFYLASIDFDQMEYKFALEQACRIVGKMTDLAELIVAGHDFHQATTDLVHRVAHILLTRKITKNANFATLYGSGNDQLARTIGGGCTVDRAKLIRWSIQSAAPELNTFIQACMQAAREKKYVMNWLGRRSWFPNPRWAYRAPNYIVSGGCADVVKVAMNRIDDYLANFKTRMILMVHDELDFEVHESERGIEQELAKIMADTYKSKFVPLTCSISTSQKSLGDLQ